MKANTSGAIDDIAENMVRVGLLLRKKLLKFDCETLDISPPHFFILVALNESGALPVSVIGRGAAISKPEMTRFTDKLAALGLVERKPDAEDRRVINLSLTEKGKQVLAEARKLIRDNIKARLSSLEPGELEKLAVSLKSLAGIALKIE
jgi:DNA-binding MarR family transcriptional regulator